MLGHWILYVLNLRDLHLAHTALQEWFASYYIHLQKVAHGNEEFEIYLAVRVLIFLPLL